MVSETEFLDLVRSHQGIIKKLAGLYAQNEEDRKDLYQEILYQTWKAFPGFRGESKFSTWLYRVSLNTILTANRKTNRISYRETIDESAATAPHQSVQQEDARQLRLAILKLNDTDKAIISLHLDGYANPEIAQIMGLTTNHTGVKLHRIKEQLSNLLQKVGP
jgi:RNA polymerase sigma-70 factor (ECF subfamily)